jgi:hypothetical protein
MAYDFTNELQKVRDYYTGDPLQQRFSALVTGETNSGKTYLLRTARKPIHIDSFDPGGTKCLLDLIEKGDVIADTQWEADDPFSPDKFAKWMKAIDVRFQIGYFDHFGTYCLDSATTWGDAVMAYGMASKGRAGEAPQHRHDYMPQKVYMVNYIKKLMRLPCDFILTGHLKENRKVIYIDTKTGVAREEVNFRFYTTGQAVVTIPLLFDEIYVIIGEDGRGQAPKRKMLIDSLGTYVARSRLKGNGKLEPTEEPDIKKLLKKAGLKWEDKPKLQKEGGEN